MKPGTWSILHPCSLLFLCGLVGFNGPLWTGPQPPRLSSLHVTKALHSQGSQSFMTIPCCFLPWSPKCLERSPYIQHGTQCDLTLFLHLEHSLRSSSAAPLGYVAWDKWLMISAPPSVPGEQRQSYRRASLWEFNEVTQIRLWSPVPGRSPIIAVL